MKLVSFSTFDDLLASDTIPVDWKWHTLYNYLRNYELHQGLSFKTAGTPCLGRKMRLEKWPELAYGCPTCLPDYGNPDLAECRISVEMYPEKDACVSLVLDAVATGEWARFYEPDGDVVSTAGLF